MSRLTLQTNPVLYGNGSGYSRKIRVLFPHNHPDVFSNCPIFPTLSPNFQCPFPGWCAEILKMICDSMDMYIEQYVYDNPVGVVDWGMLVNGTWEGVLGYLENDTVDMACLMYQKTNERVASFDYSYPVTNVQPTYIVKKAEKNIQSVLWNAFKPFSFPVWLAFLGTLVIVLLWMIVVSRVEYAVKLRKRISPLETAWQVIQLQLYERSENMFFATVAGNIILFIFALMQSGLLMELYKALILTSLLSSGPQSPFQNVDQMIQLIAEKKYQIVADYMGLWYIVSIYKSDAPHFAKLREAIRNNPIASVDGSEQALDLVETGKYIFPLQQDVAGMIMSQKRCNLVYISEGLPQVSSHYVFRRNTSFLKEFNHQIIMKQSFIQRTFNKYFMSVSVPFSTLRDGVSGILYVPGQRELLGQQRRRRR